MSKETYRNNKIEIKESGTKHNIHINGKKIATVSEEDLKRGATTDYNYIPASDPMELARRIIDEQSSLAEPKLKDLVR